MRLTCVGLFYLVARASSSDRCTMDCPTYLLCGCVSTLFGFSAWAMLAQCRTDLEKGVYYTWMKHHSEQHIGITVWCICVGKETQGDLTTEYISCIVCARVSRILSHCYSHIDEHNAHGTRYDTHMQRQHQKCG